MTPITNLIKTFEELAMGSTEVPARIKQVRVVFFPPTLHIDLICEMEKGIAIEERLEIVGKWVTEKIPSEGNLINEMMSKLPLTISVLTQEEADEKAKWLKPEATNSWVSWFLEKKYWPTPNTVSQHKYVHFYGYKGGQARSSILALFAKLLADDGYRVLVVDADMEAPSLDAIFGIFADNFSQTLMGACGWADKLTPLPSAYVGKQGGQIDLLPCRPRTEESDLDFALLVATAPLDIRIYERAAKRLDSSLEIGTYDFILVDHRTGIATSVLPLINYLPGPSAIFSRTDSNIAGLPSELKRVVRAIFSSAPDALGAFVSFSLDPNRKTESTLTKEEARVREALLGELAESMEGRHFLDLEEDQISTDELVFNWIDWYLDRSLLNASLPDVQNLQTDNIAALRKLREVLGLPIERKEAPIQKNIDNPFDKRGAILALSGAKDEGKFIHIPDVERLFTKNNPYTYILGRKGTGKTRLLKEIASRGLGVPILVAADENSFSAVRSQSAEAVAWTKACNGDAEIFWWSLLKLSLDASIQQSNVLDVLSTALTDQVDPKTLSSPVEIKNLVAKNKQQDVFLVDGLETLVRAAEIKIYVGALFGMMGTIQNDPLLSSKIVIRAFVREDLASDSLQNIEQQMEGRLVRLKWSATSILNFALSRLPTLPWISSTYGSVCDEIRKLAEEIQRGSLSEQDATEILLKVFPSRIRRNNLSTATFLRLYFSDAGGDDTNKATFYPRLYLSFLQKLDHLAGIAAKPQDADNRIDSSLLNTAYNEASTEFITETKQELSHLLTLSAAQKDPIADDDQAKVTQFISAFDGLRTPFEHDKLVSALVERTSFTESTIRESLRRMKAIRMFEDRPGFAGWWRVGQLYKMGLRMKYVR
jgi:Mrp family chromosome partitioning ATPase